MAPVIGLPCSLYERQSAIYSSLVSREDGTNGLRIRASPGRTLTFEPLEAGVKGLYDEEWRLTATLDKGRRDPDRSLALRTDSLLQGTEVTARFHVSRGVSGFGGCNLYNVKPEPEEPFARRDGTFAQGAMTIEATVKDCPDPPGVRSRRSTLRGIFRSSSATGYTGSCLSYIPMGTLCCCSTNGRVCGHPPPRQAWGVTAASGPSGSPGETSEEGVRNTGVGQEHL